MQANSERNGALLDGGRLGRRTRVRRLADVDPEIAAAGGLSNGLDAHERFTVRANNHGLIGITLKLAFSGRELDLPVSLELYEELEPEALHTYLSDAARRMGACEPISNTHRIHLLPDSY